METVIFTIFRSVKMFSYTFIFYHGSKSHYLKKKKQINKYKLRQLGQEICYISRAAFSLIDHLTLSHFLNWLPPSQTHNNRWSSLPEQVCLSASLMEACAGTDTGWQWVYWFTVDLSPSQNTLLVPLHENNYLMFWMYFSGICVTSVIRLLL